MRDELRDVNIPAKNPKRKGRRDAPAFLFEMKCPALEA
jgi:hypothetical protein